MKTVSALSFDDLPKTFDGLLKLHAPRPIHDEVGYENTVELVDLLAGQKLNKDQDATRGTRCRNTVRFRAFQC